jgi:uncharacterized protein YjbJ (UPF0337 family)
MFRDEIVDADDLEDARDRGFFWSVALIRPSSQPSGRLRFVSAYTGIRLTRTRTKEFAMSSDEQLKGKAEQAGGKLEQAQGDLTGDNKKKGEGMLDEAKGTLREGADKAREAVHDATDDK